jgi:uncharacterized membrane protein (DUF485 family)
MSSTAEPDWAALARSARFRELVTSRRRFVTRATLFYTSYFIAFLALLGYAKSTMSEEVLGISLALWGGYSVCVLTVVMAVLYARRSAEWERIAQTVVTEAGR